MIYELCVDEGNPECDDIGGPAARAAGLSNYIIDNSSKATGDSSGDSDSDSGLSEHGKQLRKEEGESNVAIMNEDEKDEEYEEPRAPINFVPANLLVIFVAGVLSNECEPYITHVCETEEATELAKVSSRSDFQLAGKTDGLSTPSKATDARPDAVSWLKRHADFNEMLKEATKNKDDLGRKRLIMNEKRTKAQVETMRKEAISREKDVTARDKEVHAN